MKKMGKLRRLSVNELNCLSASKKIWCFGCGKRLMEMVDNYQNERFINNVVAVFDNNNNLHGKEIVIGKQKIEIRSYDSICEVDNNRIILLITSDAVESIYWSIKERCKGSISIFVYPKYYRKSTNIWLKLFSKFLCENRMLFYAGVEPHENADAIVTYIKKNKKYKRLKIVFYGDSNVAVKTISNSDVAKKNNLIKTLRYCYYYGTSKYLFYENEALEKISSGQKLIYLNHGTIPLKKVSDVLKQPEDLDYAVCPSRGCAAFYEDQYGIPREKHLYAMPARTYTMFSFTGKNPWKKADEKIILWVPTFRELTGTLRKDSKINSFLSIVDSEVRWEQLDGILKLTNQRIIIKKHPRDGVNISVRHNLTNIQFITDRDMRCYQININQLLSTADAILTDYSGIAFEYMILDRPIGYVVQDFDAYSRGFSVDSPLDYMPGKIIKTYDQLCEFLDDIYKYDYKYQLKRKIVVGELFRGKEKEDGACRIVEMIFEDKLLKKRKTGENFDCN